MNLGENEKKLQVFGVVQDNPNGSWQQLFVMHQILSTSTTFERKSTQWQLICQLIGSVQRRFEEQTTTFTAYGQEDSARSPKHYKDPHVREFIDLRRHSIYSPSLAHIDYFQMEEIALLKEI